MQPSDLEKLLEEATPAQVLERISFGPDCWLWTGPKESHGYGVVRIRGRARRVHRVVFEAVYGTIPEGQVVHHTCEVKLCAYWDRNGRRRCKACHRARSEEYEQRNPDRIGRKWSGERARFREVELG